MKTLAKKTIENGNGITTAPPPPPPQTMFTSLFFFICKVTVCIQNEHVQGSPFTVQVVQSGGMILKFGRKGINVGEFNGIFGVAVDPVEGRIVVTDCHNHRVQVFSSDGMFLFHFGRKGEGSGEFQCPTGVAIDVRGQIIVCERLSYRLQVENCNCSKH